MALVFTFFMFCPRAQTARKDKRSCMFETLGQGGGRASEFVDPCLGGFHVFCCAQSPCGWSTGRAKQCGQLCTDCGCKNGP